MRGRGGGLIAFLGPSLPRAEARRVSSAQLRGPARQGDVFRALVDHPRAIALIDGVFDVEPSVWHHELIAARACGVRVYGASSMGALRAAEVPEAVIPVGVIARAYVAGELEDDAHVALLHAPAELGYRAMTVPHVNVWATARAARRRGVIDPREARALVRVSAAQFFKERTWGSVLAALDWPARRRARLKGFVDHHAVDQKALDARACLARLERAPPPRRARPQLFSSFVRHARLEPAGEGAGDDARRGLATLVLAELARAHGLTAPGRTVAAWAHRLPREGWADDERWTAAEALALEELVLDQPRAVLGDGPSPREGLRLERMRRRARSAP